MTEHNSREAAHRYLPLDQRRAARFIEDWEPVVRAQLGRMDAESDDVLFRVFDRALGGLPSFEGRSRLSTWLYRITWREAVRSLEKRKRIDDRERPLPETGADALSGMTSPADDPGAILDRKEDAERVRAALARLDPRDREIIALRFLEDLKLAEIAARLDLPLGTVKTWIHRALKRLRRELDHE